MPATSKAQYRFMAFCQHADHPSANCPKRSVAMEFTKATPSYRALPEKKSKLKAHMMRSEAMGG